jgi:hypothetical protein
MIGSKLQLHFSALGISFPPAKPALWTAFGIAEEVSGHHWLWHSLIHQVNVYWLHSGENNKTLMRFIVSSKSCHCIGTGSPAPFTGVETEAQGRQGLWGSAVSHLQNTEYPAPGWWDGSLQSHRWFYGRVQRLGSWLLSCSPQPSLL